MSANCEIPHITIYYPACKTGFCKMTGPWGERGGRGQYVEIGPSVSTKKNRNKNVNIEFSAHDMFLE